MVATPTGGGTTGQFVTDGIGKYANALGFGMGMGTGIPGAAPPALTQWDQWRLWFTNWSQSGIVPQGLYGMAPPGRGNLEGGGQERSLAAITPAQRAAQQDLREMSRERQRDRVKLKKLAEQAGVNPDDPIAMGELWIGAVNEAEAASAVSPNITPWEILGNWARDGAPGTFKREESDKSRRDAYFAKELDPYSVTHTSRNVQITDPETARALVTTVLERSLGRRPSDEEIKDFVATLNKRERANPTVTTTVENYAFNKDAGNYRQVGTSSTTTGGPPDPGAFAQGFVEDEHPEEEKAYRAGVEYASVMEALIGSL